MSTILLTYNRPSDAHKTLMSHQAIIAVVRSILASRRQGTKGMFMSEHKILVPANIDILPLLALVANDYTEFVEPEPEKKIESAPFILYWKKSKREDIDSGIIEQFVNPRWFTNNQDHPELRETIFRYKPETIVMIGEISDITNEIERADYRFRQLITFSELLNRIQAYRLRDIADEVNIADSALYDAINNSQSVREKQFGNLQGLVGYWEDMYKDDQRKPDLENFSAFGTAFEMAMFM